MLQRKPLREWKRFWVILFFFEDIEFEATHLFQFNKKDYSLYMFYRNVEKYNGVVLNQIEVRVPDDPDANY